MGLVRCIEPVSAPRRSRAQSRQHRERLCAAGEGRAAWGDQRARQGRQHPGDAGDHQRSRRVREIPGGPGRAFERAVEASGRDRELSAAQIRTLFHDLMSQLEGTENRITVACNRYIKAVQDYNVGIRTFPNNLTAMMFGYKEKANFTVGNEREISTAPKVDFNPSPAPAK